MTEITGTSWPRAVAVLNFTGMRGNWGSQATSDQLLELLRRAFAGLHEPRIHMVPYPPRHLLDIGIETGWGRTIEAAMADPHPVKAQLDLIEFFVRRRFRHFVEAVEAADLVVFQGEGTIGKPEFLRGVRLFALPILAKKRWHKPVIALNQSVYAVGSRAEAALTAILSAFDLVAVREPVSLAFCHGLGLDRPILCPDMAFLAEATSGGPLPAPLEAQAYFCFTGSAALHHYPVKDYVDLVGQIAELTGLQPVLLYCTERDKLLREVAEGRWGRARLTVVGSRIHPHYRSIMPILQRARFVIGGRYHMSILACAAGTPVVLLPANTHKQEGLAAMLGECRLVHAPWEAKAILAEVLDILEHDREHRQRILSAVARLRECIASFEQHLRHACGALMAGGAWSSDAPVSVRFPAVAERVPVSRKPDPRNARIYREANTSGRHGRPPIRWNGGVNGSPSAPWEVAQSLARKLSTIHRAVNLRANLACYERLSISDDGLAPPERGKRGKN